MTRVVLFPRLNALGTGMILAKSNETALHLSGGVSFVSEYSSLISFAASGGSRQPQAALDTARKLRHLASELGFPGESEPASRAEFDRRAAILLATSEELSSGEALRDDVWAFLTSILAADVTRWRFPEKARERFQGGVRNAFQRLWVRGRTLDRGENHPQRWLLVESLSEDAFVQIFERASIAGHRRLARMIAETWVSFANKHGRGSMESVMRRALKLVRLRNEIVDLAFLSDLELRKELEHAFATSIQRCA